MLQIIFRYTIFATHMENLSELVTVYPNVKILHFDVDIKNNRLDFKVGFFRFDSKILSLESWFFAILFYFYFFQESHVLCSSNSRKDQDMFPIMGFY